MKNGQVSCSCFFWVWENGGRADDYLFLLMWKRRQDEGCCLSWWGRCKALLSVPACVLNPSHGRHRIFQHDVPTSCATSVAASVATSRATSKKSLETHFTCLFVSAGEEWRPRSGFFTCFLPGKNGARAADFFTCFLPGKNGARAADFFFPDG